MSFPLKNLSKKKLVFGLFFLLITFSLLVFLIFLIKSINIARHQGLLRPPQSLGEIMNNEKNGRIASSTDVDYIDSWMTFKYINTVFGLPDSYLQNRFEITDKRYPNFPLKKYAADKGLDQADFLQQVKDSVISYQNSVSN